MTDNLPTQEEAIELLGHASRALRDIAKAAIVVSPLLTTPYRDEPSLSPWTRFVQQPARAAYNLGHQIRRCLGGPDTYTPADQPTEVVLDAWAHMALDAAERVAVWAYRQRVSPIPDDATAWQMWWLLEQPDRDEWLCQAEEQIRGDLLGPVDPERST